ncbi:MAG: hypothetical protein AAF297_02335 [Planctomycetota bacterium]
MCESCGYELDPTLDEPCPECGTPAARSRPERRTGSPWQQSPGLASYLRTVWGAVTNPRRLLSTIDPRGTRGLLLAHTSAATAIVLFWSSVALVPDIVRGRVTLWSIFLRGFGGLGVSTAIGIAALTLLTAIAVPTLSTLEGRGLRLLAWQRGWRFGRSLSGVVVAHGAAGWVAGLAVGAPLIAVGALAYESFRGLGISRWTGNTIGVIGFGFIVAGFILFEIFAYIGLRQCRFANAPKPSDDSNTTGATD